MSSETRTESQLKNNQQEIEQQEQPHGILETLKEAVTNTVESAKEAVFGKVEDENLDQSSSQPAAEESGMIASMLTKAKEAVFGADEDATISERAAELGNNLSERAAELKDNITQRASDMTEAAKEKAGELSERATELKENIAERASNMTEAAKEYLPEKAKEYLPASTSSSDADKKIDSEKREQKQERRSSEEREEEKEEEKEEEIEAPHIPSHIRPAVKVGGRRIVQADHPHLLSTKPVREELREKLGEDAKSSDDSSSTELTKEQEERQMAVQTQVNKMEKLALDSNKLHKESSKAYPSSYQHPLPTHDVNHAPRFNNAPQEFPKN